MSIGTVAFGGATQAAQAVQGSGHHGHGGALKSAAAALGMSTSDLRDELKSGKSLDDVAKEKGLSHTDLVAAIKKGLPQDVQSSANADQIAEDISTRKGLPPRPVGAAGGPGGPGGPPPDRDGDHDSSASSGSSALSGVLGGSLTSSQSKVLDALSAALGTDTTSLVSQLKAGTSLSSLVSAKGVDSSKLADILQNGLMFDAKA